MRTFALCLVTALGIGCGPSRPVDVKVYAVAILGNAPMLLYTAVYRADSGSQKVQWRVEGVANSEAVLEDCSVRDAFNWRCENKAQGSTAAMVNGRYETPGVAVPEGMKFLTEADWRALQQR